MKNTILIILTIITLDSLWIQDSLYFYDTVKVYPLSKPINQEAKEAIFSNNKT